MPASVVWIYAKEDKNIATELMRFSGVLETQGIIRNWSMDHILPGQPWREVLTTYLNGADVIMLLASPVLFADDLELWRQAYKAARRNERIRLVPVYLRSAILPPELTGLQALPRGGKPLMAWKDRDAGILEIIKALQELVQFRSSALPDDTKVTSSDFAPKAGQELPSSAVNINGTKSVLGFSPTINTSGDGNKSGPWSSTPININDVFKLNGPPNHTFVEPSLFNELKLELKTPGLGLILEGPSKVGKTTAIKKALEALGVGQAQQIWWHGQDLLPLIEFKGILSRVQNAQERTWLLIDDFHYVEGIDYRRTLAGAMKILADQDAPKAKVVLIGINPLAGSLVDTMPDLAGRFRNMRMLLGRDLTHSLKIAEMISLGEATANIRFKRKEEFVIAAAGSFFIAQLLCNQAAKKAGVTAPQETLTEIHLGPSDVERELDRTFSAQFRTPLIQFAAFDECPPPRGAGLALLWLLRESPEGTVSLTIAKHRFPHLVHAFDWMLSSNLTRCFIDYPNLKGLLYYHPKTAMLTMEDPQLMFFLRNLDWQAFARASGHGEVAFHQNDGPLFPAPHQAERPAAQDLITVEEPYSGPTTFILHLSDLHFNGDKDEVELIYGQLADDLRAQNLARLDAVIISGDVVEAAKTEEYEAAEYFLGRLMNGFGLAPRDLAIVPGNHDVNWEASEAAYEVKRKKSAHGLDPKTYFGSGDYVEVRNDQLYEKRWSNFAQFYQKVKGEDYSLSTKNQFTITDLSEHAVCALGLNSAWEIDHHFRDRASINSYALNAGLEQLPGERRLKIAVFHHPLGGPEDSRIRDTDFLDRLIAHNFHLILHGHIHKTQAQKYDYDQIANGRSLRIVSGGTFGAPSTDWAPGFAREYNLLRLQGKRLTVSARRQEKVNGIWEPYSRWSMGPGRDKASTFTIDL